MRSSEQIKQLVKKKYGEIVREAATKEKASGCSCCSSSSDDTEMSPDYSHLTGYQAEADFGLGCGIPTELANIAEGDAVLDLGSGAGNDVFVARAIVGETGKVIGVDMTDEMIDKANKNLAKTDYQNVEFRLGEIEKLPIAADEIDVVISNCVLNLVPNKEKAFAEIYRTLKPGGHFCISDIVTSGELPESLKKSAEMYTGCVAGALQKDEYLRIINKTGFTNVAVKKERRIVLDESILGKFIAESGSDRFHASEIAIISLTVYGEKPIA